MAAAASNRASGIRGGAYAKQRVTCSRYGSGSPASAAAWVSSGDQLGVEPGAPVGIGHLGRQAVAEGGRVVAQAGRRAELLHVDRSP